jgi:hypothetical protein
VTASHLLDALLKEYFLGIIDSEVLYSLDL